MPDPSTYRPSPGSVPDSPGVYRFRDEHGRVIYVGKAKSLRSRLNSYFADLHALHPRTATMVSTAAAVDWTVVGNEVEALQLEYTWIKEYDPRFNVKYRDDKSYPWLAVTLYEDYPRLQVMRGPKRKGVRYFGPYSHAWAIRETLDLLLRVFPARTCSTGVFRRAGQVGRPCLLGYIDRCSAPCVGRVTAEEHRRIVDDFVVFMSGRTDPMVRRLEKEMAAAAADLEFERAARIRDDLGALTRAMERQAVVLGDGTDADVVAFAEDALEAAVCVFFVRGGRVRGQRGWVVDKVEDVTTADLVESFVAQVYVAEGGEVPRTLLVPALPPDLDAVVTLLERARGGRVEVRVPHRGDKRALMETVGRNAGQSLAQHKLKRAADLTARSRALAEVQEALDLPEAPLRIECFDVSHLQGDDVVASMVVFEDGLPRKSEYRRFALRSVGGPDRAADDVAAIHEVVARRFRRFLDERTRTGDVEGIGTADEPAADARRPPDRGPIDPETGRPRKFAYPPNLVVVDGGEPQVAAAKAAITELGVENVSLCGLAKRLEEVWLPDQPTPVVMARTSEGLYLLQRVRDEAHRFAITYHRQKHRRSMSVSSLDGVPGLGETRRKALVRHFGSVKRIRGATAAEIAEVPGIGPATAAAVVAALVADPPAPAVDPLTGEVLSDAGPPARDPLTVALAGPGAAP